MEFVTGKGSRTVQTAPITPNLPKPLVNAGADVNPELASALAELTVDELRAVVAAAQALLDNASPGTEDKPTDRPERNAKRRFDAHAHNQGAALGLPRGFLAK